MSMPWLPVTLRSSTSSPTRPARLADAARILDEARAKRRLAVLDNIRIATPCPASWDRMVGDDRVRHCGDCNKNVYNLSEMTRDEAETLIVAKRGDLCARYCNQRADGTIITSDCAVGVSRRRKRRLIAAGAAALLAGGAVTARELTREHEPVRMLAGAISVTTDVTQPTTAMPGQVVKL